MNDYIILDIETGSKEVLGRTANFLYNSLISFCIKTIYVDYYTKYVEDEEEDLFTLTSFIYDAQVLVAHNLKFEALYLWKSEDFQDWLKEGGKTYCTQLGEYYLTNFQTQWAGLRDIAVKVYRLPEREKKMEVYWDKGLDTSAIPVEVVIEDNENDVRDTFYIYEEQQIKLTRKGQIFQNMLEIQNDFLLATTEMEYNGMCIDVETLDVNQHKLEEELQKEEENLQSLINEYWK